MREQLHDRVPLMLDPAVLRDWLHGGVDDAAAVTASAGGPALAWHAVHRAVGNPRSNGAQLIERIPLIPAAITPAADRSPAGNDDAAPMLL